MDHEGLLVFNSAVSSYMLTLPGVFEARKTYDGEPVGPVTESVASRLLL